MFLLHDFVFSVGGLLHLVIELIILAVVFLIVKLIVEAIFGVISPRIYSGITVCAHYYIKLFRRVLKRNRESF